MLAARQGFRVFSDHDSRSERLNWGINVVAGLGSQFRGSPFVPFVVLFFPRAHEIPKLDRAAPYRYPNDMLTPMASHAGFSFLIPCFSANINLALNFFRVLK
jgi:hypothetical protein